MTGTNRSRSSDRQLLTIAGVALGTCAAYLTWFGWHGAEDSDPGADAAWRFLGLALTLGVLAAATGWKGHPTIASFVVPISVTAMWCFDNATTPHSDGLWGIGATCIWVVSFIGIPLIAGIAASQARRTAPVPHA